VTDRPPPDAAPPSARKKQPQLVQVEGLSKLFPVSRGPFRGTAFVHAVEDVTLYVRRGETLGLVGESGSGKSTLGRTLLRLVEPTLGRVFFDGVEVTRLPDAELRALRRRMQIVFQDPLSALDPRMTVLESVSEGLEIHRLAKGRAELEARVGAALDEVGLPRTTAGRFPHELSGGQRQRVGIARALAVEPDFLVCDEPVSALDVSVQAQVLNVLADLQEKRGLAMLFISHDLRVVAHMAQRTAVMYLGRVVEVGPTRDVVDRRLHPYTRALFAASPGARGPSLPVLQGEPPSALEPPRGCAFHPRCARAEKGTCDTDVPPLVDLVAGSHHRVACFHPGE
jgi:oligopeptide transport system ATP-binding protein